MQTVEESSKVPVPPDLKHYGIVVESELGEGAFGQVYKAYDCRSNAYVAIKCFKSGYTNGIPKDILLELSALKQMSHRNLVQLLDIIREGDIFYAKLEFVDYTLRSIIKCEYEEFKNEQLYRSLLRQIMKGVHFMHSQSYVHRDLKPINILVMANGVAKIADFGGAKLTLVPTSNYIQRVGTTSYKAPEILMGSKQYTFLVDMWPIGCMMIELYLKKRLIRGSDAETCLETIFSLLDLPTECEMKGVSVDRELFDKLNMKRRKRPIGTSRLRKHLKCMDVDAFNLLIRLLQPCPRYRITAEMALDHPYFTSHVDVVVKIPRKLVK